MEAPLVFDALHPGPVAVSARWDQPHRKCADHAATDDGAEYVADQADWRPEPPPEDDARNESEQTDDAARFSLNLSHAPYVLFGQDFARGRVSVKGSGAASTGSPQFHR